MEGILTLFNKIQQSASETTLKTDGLLLHLNVRHTANNINAKQVSLGRLDWDNCKNIFEERKALWNEAVSI